MGRGEIDGIVLNTSGVGLATRVISDAGLEPGHRLILTGPIGDHGIALMARRHNLGLDASLASDVAPINGLIRVVLDAAGEAVSAMKDPTRGGVASALHEMAEKSKVGIVVHEQAVPVTPAVRSAAELLGLDPFHIANEGKAIIGVHPDAADRVLAVLRGHPLGRDAAVVGECYAEHPGRLVLDTGLGRRLMQEPEGEPLPRIC
jgi:hydrogenase expression/formation protein HypE